MFHNKIFEITVADLLDAYTGGFSQGQHDINSLHPSHQTYDELLPVYSKLLSDQGWHFDASLQPRTIKWRSYGDRVIRFGWGTDWVVSWETSHEVATFFRVYILEGPDYANVSKFADLINVDPTSKYYPTDVTSLNYLKRTIQMKELENTLSMPDLGEKMVQFASPLFTVWEHAYDDPDDYIYFQYYQSTGNLVLYLSNNITPTTGTVGHYYIRDDNTYSGPAFYNFLKSHQPHHTISGEENQHRIGSTPILSDDGTTLVVPYLDQFENIGEPITGCLLACDYYGGQYHPAPNMFMVPYATPPDGGSSNAFQFIIVDDPLYKGIVYQVKPDSKLNRNSHYSYKVEGHMELHIYKQAATIQQVDVKNTMKVRVFDLNPQNDTWEERPSCPFNDENDVLTESYLTYGRFRNVAISADGSKLLIGGTHGGSSGDIYHYDNIQRIWSSTSVVSLSTEHIDFVSMTSDASRIIMGYHTVGQPSMYIMNDEQQYEKVQNPDSFFPTSGLYQFFTFSSTGQYLALSSPKDNTKGQVKLWEKQEDGKYVILDSIMGQQNYDNFGVHLAFSRDNDNTKLIIGNGRKNSYNYMWHLPDLTTVQAQFPPFKSVAFSQNRLYFVKMRQDSNLSIWDFEDGNWNEKTNSLDTYTDIHNLSVNWDGTYLVLGKFSTNSVDVVTDIQFNDSNTEWTTMQSGIYNAQTATGTGDPYITTFSGFRCKLPNLYRNYRLMDTVVNNKRLLINASVSMLGHDDQRNISLEGKRVEIQHAVKDGYYFEEFYVSYGKQFAVFDRYGQVRDTNFGSDLTSDNVKLEIDPTEYPFSCPIQGKSRCTMTTLSVYDYRIKFLRIKHPQIVNGIEVVCDGVFHSNEVHGVLNSIVNPKYFRIKHLKDTRFIATPRNINPYMKHVKEKWVTSDISCN